jgi:prepilin-type N-terminal cleavage/methylation domain-containing protein
MPHRSDPLASPRPRTGIARGGPPVGSQGFTLIETVIAIGLLAVLCAGAAQLLGASLARGRTAEETSLMTMMAAAKLEELRSLEWSVDAAAAPPVLYTDTSTDLSQPGSPGGGAGLGASGPGTLDTDTASFTDYLDARGGWVGSPAAPAGIARAVYVRRWAISRLPGDPERTLALQVLVAPLRRERQRTGGRPRAWTGEDVLLETMVTRRAR